MALDVEINGNPYTLVENRDGSKVSTRPVQQFVQPIRQTGRTRPEDLAPYESFIFPNLSYGFGRRRINSDAAFDPKEYRRFLDSTCDTRWMDSVYLPIMSEASTKTTDDQVIRASTSFKGELNSLWENTTSTLIANRQFTGSNTTWENGGVFEATVDATSSGTGTAVSSKTISHTCSGTQRLLIVGVALNDSSSPADPTGVTYNSDALTKAGTTGNFGSYNRVSIWYRVAPDTGTNNIVVTLDSAVGSVHVSAISFTGIDQTNPLGTFVSATASSTAPTVTTTTVADDYVFDMVGGHGTDAATVGTNQTQLTNATTTYSGQPLRSASSREIASGTSTVMNWTLGGSIDWGTCAVPVKVAKKVGLDMIQDKTNLVALVAQDDDHLTFTSTDGATWTASTTQITAGLLTNIITTNEDIDAGLLASIGGELVAAIWHESNGTITFFSSTNAGVVWADENIDIASANGPQGLAVYPDIDGTNKLYLATAEGIYVIDTSPSTWTFDLIFAMPGIEDDDGRNHNGRRMVVHQGSLWFAQGVDNNSPVPIYRMTVQGDSRVIESGFGLSFGDGVPDDLLGPVFWMKSAGDFLFASVGGNEASRNGRLICWNGNGWHHMPKYPTANNPIEWIDIGTGDDGTPRLHYAVRDSASASLVKFLGQPLVNPRSGVAIKRDDQNAALAGHIELPFLDFGIPSESKLFTSVHINADDLTDTSNEYVEVEYGINNAATTTDLGNFTSTTSKVTFASDIGISAKNIGLRLKVNRGSTNTDTPKIKDIVVEGYVVPDTAYEHNMVIDIEETAKATGQNVETVISNLQTLISTVTQMTFKFGQVDKKVAVDRERSNFSYGINSWEVSGAPNALATRSGTFNLTLIEKIAS